MKYNLGVIEEDCKKLYDKIGSNLDELRNKSVMVTGANGLLGGFTSDFIAYLNDHHGFNMRLNLTSLSHQDNATRISHLLDKEYVRYFSWDLRNSFPEDQMPDVDFVFFMSGYGQPKKFISNKTSTIFLNTVGLSSLIEFYKKKRGTKLLYVSSSETYGDPDESKMPVKESYNGNYSVESNRACYITSKRLGEVICFDHMQNSDDMKIVVARLALTYGPGTLTNDDRVLQNFIVNGQRNGKIQLLDDGSAIRSCLYITDCLEMMLNITLHGKQKVYNISGDHEQVTIFDLASIVADEIKVEVRKGEVAKAEEIKFAPKRVVLSLDRYNSEFGPVKDPVKLRNGVKNVVSWYSCLGEK